MRTLAFALWGLVFIVLADRILTIQLRRRWDALVLAPRLKAVIRFMEKLGEAVVQFGVTAREAAASLSAFAQVWQRIPGQDEFGERSMPLYRDLCWRCYKVPVDPDDEFGCCTGCADELRTTTA